MVKEHSFYLSIYNPIGQSSKIQRKERKKNKERGWNLDDKQLFSEIIESKSRKKNYFQFLCDPH